MDRQSEIAELPEVDYPESDGKPMDGTPLHRRNMTNLIETLDSRYEDDPNVYVSGNMFLYYERGNTKKSLVPDVMLVRGVPKVPERRVFKVWDEGKGPDFVVEVTSRSTRDEDLGDKFELYRDRLRVREYFLFDPEAEYLAPPLQGYRLDGATYRRIEMVDGRLPSEVIGLHLEWDDWEVRLYDPEMGRRVLTPRERSIQADVALARVEIDRARAWKMADLARAEADEEARKARTEAERAKLEAERARVEADRADAEAAGRRRAEDEVERLKQAMAELLRARNPGELNG